MADLTDEGWLALLQSRLAQQQPAIKRYEAYFAGHHPLAFDSEPYRESFGRQLAEFSDNWMELVVEAPVERLAVLGFRFTATASPDLETPALDVVDLEPDPMANPADDAGGNPADSDAWAIWQANRLDAESVKAHTDAGKLATSFLLVSPPPEVGDGTPRITVEHPSQVIAVRDPADRRRVLAALKRYTAPNADEVAVVYTPEYISTFVSPRGAQSLLAAGIIIPGSYIGAWTQHSSVPNPLGVVPIVPMENRPGTLGGGISDLRPAIALNDAANKFFSDMIVASEFAAFPQRVATGVEIPRGADGQPTPGAELQASIKRLWAFENDAAKVTSLPAADLGNYVKAIELSVQHLAAQPLALDTVVPTPTGRTTMGALVVGDQVFDPDGNVQRVNAVSPVFRDRDCYRLRFSDGTEIVADAGHLWRTTHYLGASRNRPRVSEDVSTEEIARTLLTRTGLHNHYVPVAKAPDGPARDDLSIDPYVLGVWLGDGCRGRNQIASHPNDAPEMVRHLAGGGETITVLPGRTACVLSVAHDFTRCRYGHTLQRRGDRMRCLECHRIEVYDRRHGRSVCRGDRVNASFVERLDDLGIKWEKRIPERYFLGSAGQRLALLQGLMDADGSASKRGQVSFTSYRESLARDVWRLVQSLGHKATLREGRSEGFGLVGTCWRMSWSAPDPVFRMERKRARQRTDWSGESRRRYIVACEPVPSEPVRCIRVSGDSHLFCVTDAFITTHNTRTPPHYLLGQIVNIAADALIAAEAGLVSKVQRKQLDFGESWEEAMRLAFRWRALWRRNNGDVAGAVLDEVRGTDMAAETIWRNAESRSPAVIADAAVKKRAVGVPEEMIWEELGYSPRQIERMRVMRTAELAQALARQAQTIEQGGKVSETVRDIIPGD